jgi:hypothetical protein
MSVCGFQAHHVEHQRGAIVAAAGIERGRDQCASGIFGGNALAHDGGDELVREIAMDAVAAQQKAVVLCHRLTVVIEPHLRLDAQRASKDIRPAGATAVAYMIGRETAQVVAAQPVGAAVADMQHMGDAPAQHQRSERAAHAGQRRIALALTVDPAIERTDDGRRRAAHLHGLGHVAKAVEKTAHRGFGGDAAALGAADAVGDGRNHVATRLRQFPAEDGAAKILVALARPGFRGKADTRLDAGEPLNHRHA